MRVLARLLLPLALATIPALTTAAEAPEALKAAVDSAIEPLLAEHDIPGMAVAVTVAGQRYFFNYGVASKADATPVTEETLFELGSVSKTFTATLATYAEATGRLSLADHPSTHLAALQDTPIDRATLLNLGTYTAGGLPLQFPDGIDDDAALTAYFQQWQPAAAPDTERQYSNPSIGLLGHLTGLALGGDFADQVETELFPAFGLDQSFVEVPESAMANYAWGYGKSGQPVRVNPGALDAEAYGVKSTAADVLTFTEANITPRDLPEDWAKAVTGTHLAHFTVGEMVQGLGWEQYPYPVALDQLLAGNSTPMALEANPVTPITPPRAPSEPTFFNKTGSTGGFGAYVAFVPAEQVGVVMLANKNYPNAARVTAGLAILDYLTGNQP